MCLSVRNESFNFHVPIHHNSKFCLWTSSQDDSLEGRLVGICRPWLMTVTPGPGCRHPLSQSESRVVWVWPMRDQHQPALAPVVRGRRQQWAQLWCSASVVNISRPLSRRQLNNNYNSNKILHQQQGSIKKYYQLKNDFSDDIISFSENKNKSFSKELNCEHENAIKMLQKDSLLKCCCNLLLFKATKDVVLNLRRA